MISYAEAFPSMSVRPDVKSVSLATKDLVLEDVPTPDEAMTYKELKEWLESLDEDTLNSVMLVRIGKLIFAWGRPITYAGGAPGTFNPILVKSKIVINKDPWKDWLSRSIEE